jgi:ubiquitin C-terminal hydrolase
MGDLVPYDARHVPRAFGLTNTGVICYFNALLQGLASCPSLVTTVIENHKLMGETATGRAFYSFMRAVQESATNPDFVVDGGHSSRVLAALVADVQRHRPRFQFGGGMESATEGLTLLLDMIEPPSAKAPLAEDGEARVCQTEAVASVGQQAHPVLSLFHLRLRDRVWCRSCQAAGEAHQGVVSHRVDRQYQYMYMHYDGCLNKAISTPEEFTTCLLKNLQFLEDFKCEDCRKAGRPEAPPKGQVFRLYEVRRIPSVLVIIFNQYTAHTQRYYPEEFTLDGATKDKKLRFRLVSQLEHSGSLHSGHYWARAVRRAESSTDATLQTHTLNDASVSPGRLGPAASVYTLLYHYVRTE